MNCVKCGSEKWIKYNTIDGSICAQCYKLTIQPKKVCSVCNQTHILGEQNPPICKICCDKKRRQVQKHVKGICKKCNRQIHILSKGFCADCYRDTHLDLCKICNQQKPVARREQGRSICPVCRERQRYHSDPIFNTIKRLRHRLREAINKFSKTEKCGLAKDYGINYQSIAKHLGPCPGDRKDWHIDHIKPLVLFDFTDPLQIQLAFAPENHQWLLKEENLKKNAIFK